MKIVNCIAVELLLFINLLIIPTMALAQSFYLNPLYHTQITLQALKPNFDGPDNSTFTTATYFLNFKIRLNPSIDLVGDFPLAHFADKQGSGFSSLQTSAGNPFLGIRLRGRSKHISGEFGFRIPVISDSKFRAAAIGLVSDIDRFEAFLPRWLPISANLHYTTQLVHGVSVLVKAGGTFLINTDRDPSEDGSEFYLKYALGIRQVSRWVQAMIAISGRLHATQSNLNIGQRTVYQLGFSADILFKRIAPGLEVRVPLDKDLTRVLDFVAGVRVTIPLNPGGKENR